MSNEVREMHIGPKDVYVNYDNDTVRAMRVDGASASPKRKLKYAGRSSWLCLLLLLLNAGLALSQTTQVKVDASMANQTFEGWGTSLNGFANSVGGWTNTTNQNNMMQDLFNPSTGSSGGPSTGLGLTYIRYNIGGGDDPLCGTGSPHYVCVSHSWWVSPGYESANGTYDWTQDANQRWVLTSAKNLGANLFEAVSYSPPYWMTISGTSQGGVNGAANLASGYFGSGSGTFADYLTTVVKHFNTDFGITFHHLEPINEPGATYWKAGDGLQEGCAFTLSGQEQIIQNVQGSLANKGLVTQVSAMDEYQEGNLNTNAQSTAYEFYSYDAITLGDMTALNTHGYASLLGSAAVAASAQHYGKRVVMSEWGMDDVNGNTSQGLSTHILNDINTLRPVAWTIWQPHWPTLMTIDFTNQAYTLQEPYYVFEQYTKFIRPGFQFIAIGDSQSLAAFNQQTQTLVIVTQNWGSSPRTVNYQLSNFTSPGTSAAVYQTSASPVNNFASQGNTAITGGSFSYSVAANSVTTFVIANTSYTPTATTVNDNTTGTGSNQFNYVGSWGYNGAQSGAYHTDNHWSGRTDDYYTFTFTGQQARVYASMTPNGGIAAFSVDNGAETYFDTYAATRVDDVFLFATPTLAQGTHTLKVRVTGLQNPASSGAYIPADRIDVVSGGTEVGQGIYKIVNVRNGKDLEVNGGSLADGGLVDIYPDVSGANNEHWNLMAVGDGSYRIVNVNSGLDLEVNGWSTSNGGTVSQWQDNGPNSTNEYWNLVAVGDGSYRIVNVHSGLDLEVNGTSGVVDQYQDVSGATNEHWTLTPTN